MRLHFHIGALCHMQLVGAQNYHSTNAHQPSLISTVVGALALLTPVVSERARLHDPAKPLSVQGFIVDTR